MNALFCLNPYALPRILFRHTKFMSSLPGVINNARVGTKDIDENVFKNIILRNIAPVSANLSIGIILNFIFYFRNCILPGFTFTISASQ